MFADTRTGFKVVNPLRDGTLVSTILNSASNRGRTEYCTERWSVPNPDCGPLCVFHSLGDAVRFARSKIGEGVSRVFSCDYEPAASVPANAPCSTIWEPDGYGRFNRGPASLPEGTVLASRVKLTRPMSNKEILEAVNAD